MSIQYLQFLLEIVLQLLMNEFRMTPNVRNGILLHDFLINRSDTSTYRYASYGLWLLIVGDG